MALKFGIGLGQDQDVHNVGQYAKVADDLGFHHVTMIDMGNLGQEVNVMMTLAAVATERIQIGHGVTNPATYHPGVIANTIASLRELTDGRAFCRHRCRRALWSISKKGGQDGDPCRVYPVHQGLFGR